MDEDAGNYDDLINTLKDCMEKKNKNNAGFNVIEEEEENF
jgi:hypothetical protein